MASVALGIPLTSDRHVPHKSDSTSAPALARSICIMHSSRHVFLCFFISLLSSLAKADKSLLPKPDGPYEVGMGVMELIDKSKTQLFAPTAEPRKFMVSSFYPVGRQEPITPISYLPPETAAFEDSFQEATYGLDSPSGTFEKLELPLADKLARIQHNFPLVLFSPAQGTSRLFYGAIATTVASWGYIVVTIDAPYDVDIVEYPDGSEAIANATIGENPTAEDITEALTARIQDVSFVLDQLREISVVSQLIPSLSHDLDLCKVGMFGHSLGGAATATTLLNDERVVGGIAMDGALFGDVVDKGLNKPFMLMASTNRSRTDDNAPLDPDNSWFDIWSKLTALKVDITLANSEHYTFSDFPIILKTLGIVPNATVATNLQVTDLDGARALKIVTTYVTAFFDKVLKHKHSPLLNGPVPAFPEVTFER